MFGNSSKSEAKNEGVSSQLRRYFLAGLITVGPIGITMYVVYWVVTSIDQWIKPILDTWFPSFLTSLAPLYENYIRPNLPEPLLNLNLPAMPHIPGAGLVFGIFLLIFVGALATNLFGRYIVRLGEAILHRLPVVRGVYKTLKQIFETVLSNSNNTFQQVGVIEYPRPGVFAMVFVSTHTSGEIPARLSEKSAAGFLSVFLPTTPNPTSGFLLFVPREDVTILDMKVEDAAKMIISAGLVEPDYHGPYNPYQPTPSEKLPPALERARPEVKPKEEADILSILSSLDKDKSA